MRYRDVEIVNWNPRRYHVRGTRWAVGSRKNNFGDLLGPLIAKELVQGILPPRWGERLPSALSKSPKANQRLVAVGSIMHLARTDDCVWGTGVNGKIAVAEHKFSRLDIRAVRGPLTAKWLAEHKGIKAPDIFGDPGLLVGHVYPHLKLAAKKRKLVVIPNLNEVPKFSSHPSFISPQAPLGGIMKQISESEGVVGSSLHAIVIADSLGIPAALIRSSAEPSFKYEDYFLGSGRRRYEVFESADSAAQHLKRLQAQSEYSPLENWDGDRLLNSFPTDLWSASEVSHEA